MSIELPPAPRESDVNPEMIDEINEAMGSVNAQEEMQAPEIQDTREVSPLANAARRIAEFLDRRATNVAHKRALKEYSKMDDDDFKMDADEFSATNDYTKHLVALSETQADGNIATIEQQQSTGRDLLEKQNRKIDRGEFIDEAKDRIRGFGASVLNVLRKTGKISTNIGLTGLGLGLLAGEAAGRGVKKGAQAVAEKATDVRDSVTSFAEDRANDVLGAVNGAYQEAEWRFDNAKQDVSNKAELAAYDLGELKGKYSINNAKQKIKDKAELFKGGVDELSLSVTEYRLAQTQRAKEALARRVNRIKAFGDATGEKLDNIRQTAKQRRQRIGHHVTLTLNAAHESGELFRKRMQEAKNTQENE